MKTDEKVDGIVVGISAINEYTKYYSGFIFIPSIS